MKREIDKPMRKKTLIASIVATALWFALFVAFIPLAVLGKVPNDASRYLAIVSVLPMIWIPFVLLLFRVRFDFTVLLVYLVFIF